jgi:hypothetical protein
MTAPPWTAYLDALWVDGVTLDHDVALGRVLRATRPFAAGSTVLAEPPFVVIPAEARANIPEVAALLARANTGPLPPALFAHVVWEFVSASAAERVVWQSFYRGAPDDPVMATFTAAAALVHPLVAAHGVTVTDLVAAWSAFTFNAHGFQDIGSALFVAGALVVRRVCLFSTRLSACAHLSMCDCAVVPPGTFLRPITAVPKRRGAIGVSGCASHCCRRYLDVFVSGRGALA